MKKFLVPFLAFVLAFGLFSIDPAFAQSGAPGAKVPSPMIMDQDNVNSVQQSTSFGGSAREGALTVVNYFLKFLGLVATAMFIYGGYMYIVGGEAAAEKSKKILMYAAIGIIIVLISFAVVNTIIGSGDNAGTGFQ